LSQKGISVSRGADLERQTLQLWRKIRTRSFVMGRCACACSLSPVTIRDFETALIFHIASQYQASELGEALDLEELIERLALDTSTSLPASDAAIKQLENIQAALNAFSRQCGNFSAEQIAD
jgi:hypothetical protein